MTVGLAFSRTFWSFNYVNTAYVALYVATSVVEGNCSDAGDVTARLREMTTIDDQFVLLSRTVMARWPKVHAEPLNLITACKRAATSAGADSPPQFELNTDAVHAIESLKGYSTSGARLFPIGVVGNLREGKSTLQNMFMQLYHIGGNEATSGAVEGGKTQDKNVHEASNATAAAASSLELFETSEHLVSKTRGANCYMLPYFRDQQTWIVFVDFEGFGDPAKPIHFCSDYDVRLFAIAIAILKCMLYNTRSAVDHYVIDRLKALKFVADDSLFSSLPLPTRKPKPVNKPSVFLVLRDFNLRMVDRTTKTAVSYYKNLLFSESKESSDFLTERFERLEVHPLPKPIETDEIHTVSRLPLTKLVPDFQVAVKRLAKDTGFWAEDSQQCPESAPTDLDTFQQFATRVTAAIEKVNKSKSKPLMMTAILAHQAVDSVVFTMEEQIQQRLNHVEFPMPAADLDAVFKAECNAVHKEFIKRVTNISSARVGGEGSLEMVVSDAWSKVREKADRERVLLVARNEKEAHALATSVREELMANAPSKDKLMHPQGTEECLLGFMSTTSPSLLDRLTLSCPSEIANKHIDEFNDNLMRMFTSYEALNNERRQAERQRAEQEEAALENRKKYVALLEEKGDQEAKLEYFVSFTRDLNEKLERTAQEHADKLVQLAGEHHHGIEEVRAGAEAQAKYQLEDQRRDLEKQIRIAEEKFTDQLARANKLQNQLNEHRCGGGCLPGDTLIMTQAAGTKMLKDVQVGEFILVASRVSEDGQALHLRFEPVGGFFDHKPNSVAPFVTLELDSSAPVSLTVTHLIWCQLPGDDERPRLIQASKVAPGMQLIDASGVAKRTVTRVKRDVKLGVFSPFVPSGSIVANGVRVSVYAKPWCLALLPISDEHLHTLCHIATLSMRVAAQWTAARKWNIANHHICHCGTKLLKLIVPVLALLVLLWLASAFAACV